MYTSGAVITHSLIWLFLPHHTDSLVFCVCFFFHEHELFLHVCLYVTTCVPGAQGVQKRASGSLRLELDSWECHGVLGIEPGPKEQPYS